MLQESYPVCNWEVTEGYKIKSLSDTVLEIGCNPVDPEATPIPGTEGASNPTLSPDGTDLAFVTYVTPDPQLTEPIVTATSGFALKTRPRGLLPIA